MEPTQNTTFETIGRPFWESVQKVEDPRIRLLRDEGLIRWMCGDTSFLKLPEEYIKKNKTKDNEQYKIAEDKWGQSELSSRRPDLKPSGQWTTKLGEHICEEFQYLKNKEPKKPIKKNNFEPDVETDEFMWEVKTQTYFTEGTAGEKILGVPIKYADVPELYGKPLSILCIGCAEQKCRNQYGVLPGPAMGPSKQKILNFYESMNISYIGATDLMQNYNKQTLEQTHISPLPQSLIIGD
jgi:hypothetical protein